MEKTRKKRYFFEHEVKHMFDARNALREYLNETGIRQSHLARKCGIRSDCLSRMLNGRRRIRADELLLLCQALHLTVEQLSRYDRQGPAA